MVKDLMVKDLYLVLGVDTNPSAERINAAYREHAKELRSDRDRGERARFVDLQQAYSVLHIIQVPLTRFGTENFYPRIRLFVTGT